MSGIKIAQLSSRVSPHDHSVSIIRLELKIPLDFIGGIGLDFHHGCLTTKGWRTTVVEGPIELESARSKP